MTKKKAEALAANLRAQAGNNFVQNARPLKAGVHQQVSYTLNDGPAMYMHGENDFRPAPPGSESPVLEAEQNAWAGFGDDFVAGEWFDEALFQELA